MSIGDPSTAERKSDHEVKYVMAAERAVFVERWLAGRCLPDPYSQSIVQSIYFDTIDRRFLRDADDGDFLKTKVRIRCYLDCKSGALIGGPFLEIKHKNGSRREKTRKKIEPNSRWFDPKSFGSSQFQGIDRLVEELGEHVPGPLLPAVEIRYRRRRFIEPTVRARVCVDSGIHVARANRQIQTGLRMFHNLATSVLEFKAEHLEMPPSISPTIEFGCRKSSFSKYARCCNDLSQS